MLDLDVLLMLQGILHDQQLRVSSDEFEATALAVIKAKNQVAAAIAAAKTAEEVPPT